MTVFREQVRHEGWTTLAEYADHTPAILTRTMGQGRLVYLNAVYQSHHYIQWVTPTGADRQGFYQLVEWLCEQAGARRTLRLDGRLDELLHVAVKQFTDPTGQIRYAILRTSGEVPWVACRLRWLGPETACYDVLGGEARGPAPALGTDTPFVFRPGEGHLLAFTTAAVKRVQVTAAAPQSVAGQPLALTVQVLDEADRPIPGSFPFELQVSCDGREIAGLARSFSAPSGQPRHAADRRLPTPADRGRSESATALRAWKASPRSRFPLRQRCRRGRDSSPGDGRPKWRNRA